MILLCKKRVFFLWFVLLFGAAFHSINAQSSSVDVLKTPIDLTDFELFDHKGDRFTLAQLKNQWSLVFLGFTSCPDICPLTMSKLEGVRAELGLHFSPAKIPNIIFVAVDPVRDAPILGEYLKHFHPKNIGVTGEFSQLDILVKDVGGFYRLDKKNKTDTVYDVVDTASIAVINSDAQMVAKINPPFNVNATAWDLTLLIRQGMKNE